MRFGLVHRIMTDLLAALGVLAVVNTASMTPWTTAFVLVGLGLSLAIPESWQGRPAIRHLSTVAPLLLFAVQGVRLLAGRSVLDIAVEFAAMLQIVRLATRRGAAHDQQIIVLALLHFVAGTVLGGGLSYGLCFFGFLVVAPGALVLSHLRREVEGNYRQGARDRTGLPVDVPRILRSRRVVGKGFLASTCLLSIPIFLFTAALFVLFPRVGLSLLLLNHSRSDRMTGFTDRVDLGDVGVLRNVPIIALRFDVEGLKEPPPAKLTLRMRGTAFDRYDGRAWSRSNNDRQLALQTSEGMDTLKIVRYPDARRGDRKVTIDLEPLDPPVVFLPLRAVAVRIKPQQQGLLNDSLALHTGPEGELRYAGADAHGLHYDVYVATDREQTMQDTLSAFDRARYLQLPSKIPQRVADLAHRWADGETTPYAKARAIETHLRTEYTYDLGSPSQGKPLPVDHFLFESKRGHCEFFSTAMAIMLRQVGIPSRNVTGFVGGTYNRFGRYYAVREGDAHSWVEAYIDAPVGAWVTFDSTPPAAAQPLQPTTGPWVYMRDFVEALAQRWNRYVVGYDLKTQGRLFDEVRAVYARARNRTGLDKGPLEKVTRAPVIAAVALAMSAGFYFAWKRRRGGKDDDDAKKEKEKPDPRAELATALYRNLELALSTQGIARPAATPPLRHAEDLTARHHPLAQDVMTLTRTYIEARFGGVALDDGTAKDFERRVRQIRSYKPDVADAS